MMKYFALTPSAHIGPVEIIKETESSVYVKSEWNSNGERRDKISETRGYFDTWVEARDFLLSVEEGKIATLTRELARRQVNVRKIQEMTE